MVKMVNRAYVNTPTTGTGTITLGSPLAGQRSFADAGVVDGDVVRYIIEDGNNWEIGSGTYAASGTTLSRTVIESSNSNAAINLSGNAVVFISAIADDFFINRPFDPTVSTNPPNVGVVWVNSTSGYVYVCIDNTVDNNVWRQVDGSSTITPASIINYLVVAGGGGGSNYGGGGAGGLLYVENHEIQLGQSYTIVVGSGGGGGTTGTNGGNSSAFGSTSVGGGRGGVGTSTPGASGGSGGGGGYAGSANAGGSGTAQQGNNGGAGLGVTEAPFAAGGGGGAGAAGGNGSSTIAGSGGSGSANSITGSSVFYAGGGGGGHFSGTGGNAPGGAGGGGTGGKEGNNGTAGSLNTGGGGGGAGNTISSGYGGGSGVVILRSNTLATATTGSPTITTDGSFTIYKFTGSGSITF